MVPPSGSPAAATSPQQLHNPLGADASRLALHAVMHNDKQFECAFNAFIHHIYTASSWTPAVPAPGRRRRPVKGIMDSGANVHLWKLKDARKFFRDHRSSTLNVRGIAKEVPADLQGHLLVNVIDEFGHDLVLDFGVAHALNSLPVNLLSVSRLMQQGAIVHFEEGNSYFQPFARGSKVPLEHRNGLFELDLTAVMQPGTPDPATTYSLHGICYGAHADAKLWHRRVRHTSMETLKRVREHHLVEGFSLHGKIPSSCPCDVCRQAKIRRRANVRESPYHEAATYVGHTVSTDVKSLPYASIRGYKYVIVYVDHYSNLSVCYFMRHKNETASTLQKYLREMQRLGVTVRTIQSDRGSEYFAQEGSTHQDRDRRQAEFTRICQEAPHLVHHVVTAVEMKEKRAEVSFRIHFEAADCMLWEARLSPVFWADAVMYSCYLAG